VSEEKSKLMKMAYDRLSQAKRDWAHASNTGDTSLAYASLRDAKDLYEAAEEAEKEIERMESQLRRIRKAATAERFTRMERVGYQFPEGIQSYPPTDRRRLDFIKIILGPEKK
jgi:hypothetical protein